MAAGVVVALLIVVLAIAIHRRKAGKARKSSNDMELKRTDGKPANFIPTEGSEAYVTAYTIIPKEVDEANTTIPSSTREASEAYNTIPKEASEGFTTIPSFSRETSGAYTTIPNFSAEESGTYSTIPSILTEANQAYAATPSIPVQANAAYATTSTVLDTEQIYDYNHYIIP